MRFRLLLLVGWLVAAASAQAVEVCDCVDQPKDDELRAACDALVASMDQQTLLSKAAVCRQRPPSSGEVDFCYCTRGATNDPDMMEACKPVYRAMATMDSAELSAKTLECSGN